MCNIMGVFDAPNFEFSILSLYRNFAERYNSLTFEVIFF